jgi:DNA-binding CsgD family transcriptional regulator/energy-coupling factor transporter ATP-binding protein EcfA2
MLRAGLKALSDGLGGVWLVTGPAGSGKSTLLAEVAGLAADDGILVFHGGADPAAQTAPLGAILDAIVSTDDPLIDQARLRHLSQSPDQRFWLLRELQESLEKITQRAPLLIIIDDLHWADAATASALLTLSRRLATHRIGWLLALRRDELAGAMPDAVGRLEAAGASAVQLQPLDEATVGQVARDMLGGEPDEALREVLHRADGQPFLLTELLRGLQAENLVTVDGGTAKLAPGARLPRRLVDMVAGQLARLTGPARDAVEMASVLGHSFSLDELAGLLARPPLELRGEVREAIAAQLLTEDGDRLGFRHDLVREAVDASLPKAVRRSMRRTAVDVMLEHGASPADVAQLVMDVAEPGDARSADLLRRAAAQIGQVSPAVAVPLARRVLELMPRGEPGRGEAVGQAIYLLARDGQAAEAAKLLAVSDGDLDPVAEAQARLAVATLMLQYTPSAVTEQCRAALRLPGIPPTLRVHLLSLLACGLDVGGESEAAAGPVADALAEAAACDIPAAEVITFVPRALLAFARGDWREASALIDEGARRQHEPKDLRFARPDTFKALLLISQLRLAEAHALIEAGSRMADNASLSSRVWSMLRCRARLAAGQLADASAEAEAILEMSDEIGDGNIGYLNHIARYVLGDIALRTGNPTALQAARQDAAALYDTPSACVTTKRLGAWLTVQLDGGPISPELLDVLASGYLHAHSLISHSDVAKLVRLLLEAGQRTDAASVTARLVSDAGAKPGFPGLQAAALHAQALLDADPELAMAAVHAYRDDPRPLVRAAASETAGRLLREQARDKAVGYLDEALRLQSAADAERDAARVRRLLRDCGALRAGGHQGRAPEPWARLTASELAIVRLVVQGATDREVAQQLYISAHTVNSHLRHVFAKLGIRSRVELARLAGEHQAAG